MTASWPLVIFAGIRKVKEDEMQESKHTKEHKNPISSSPLPILKATDIPSDPAHLYIYGDAVHRTSDTVELAPRFSSDQSPIEAMKVSHPSTEDARSMTQISQQHVIEDRRNEEYEWEEEGWLEPAAKGYPRVGSTTHPALTVSTHFQHGHINEPRPEVPNVGIRGYRTPQGWHAINILNRNPGIQMSASNFDEILDRFRENIENDRNRKYSDHDYYLQFHGLPPQAADTNPEREDIDLQQSEPDAEPEVMSITSDTTITKYRVKKLVRFNLSTAVERNDTEEPQQKMEVQFAKRAWKEISGGVEEIVREKRKKTTILVSFHEDEDSWILLFFEKIKAVIQDGQNIQIPNDTIFYRLFNEYFDGKILKGPDGQPLPPRTTRLHGTLYNRIRRNASEKLLELREEIFKTLEDSTGGLLYIPMITDQELQQCVLQGTVKKDDPKNPASNLGLSLSENEVKQNEARRYAFNRKRKQTIQAAEGSYSPDRLSPESSTSP